MGKSFMVIDGRSMMEMCVLEEDGRLQTQYGIREWCLGREKKTRRSNA